ncbi:hypothetical protein HCB45_07250 [Listeria sp. FSL L7-0091]|uniref:Uncharacterized protein n=1 Tax=Listeria farberi TaxID=2713500 RepID=A0A7X1DFE6_9LIST|nr:hypothetical protein [Listeria farberi]MBC1376634.1 hypothetical protein [Listeria farberi]MBC1382419.1 hypothetical protein [Listeria farberi]MBC2261388.1 hypothetical protein [Listeria farberi]MBC2268721.1 hypothetical protein [Listeria farberi]MBC2288650.1 hypothetical protein [Listeria farberi]
MKKHIVLIVVACITVIAVFMYIIQVNSSELKYQNRAQIKIASQLASHGYLGENSINNKLNYK